MITIEKLDIHFDVEGNEEEAVFIRLFQKHIQLYDEKKMDELVRRRRLEQERALGDQPPEEY